ncbi:MAG: cation diffusion facilitator family transporter [Campylobacterales bacterium]
MSLQRKATIISSITAFILIMIKLIVGLASGAIVVLASAIDSILDLVVSLFNYFAIRQAEKPSDELFNYGRGKVEALAGVFEGAIITLSGLFIIYASINKIVTGAPTQHLEMAVWVMGASMVITLALVLFLDYVARKTGNLVVQADALHYKSDLFSNTGILASLAVIWATGADWLDPLIAIVIALYIIYSAYGIIKEGILMLMDRALDEELVEEIKRVIMSASPRIKSYHYLRTRRSGNTYIVDVHLVFDESISLLEAHHAGDLIEERIKALRNDAAWIVTIHLDPKDDSMMVSHP